jgi:DNA-binding NarL/FixJ family response regulator
VTLRVLVADDHPVFRSGLQALLSALPDVDVVGEAPDGEQAVAMAEELRPDVVLMDLDMPVLGGVAATRRVRALGPPAPRVLVLTMVSDTEAVLAAVQAGASGYLLKGADADDVQRALVAVARGDAVFGAGAADSALKALASPEAAQPFPELTSREREVLRLLGRGLPNGHIARELGLTGKTVQNYVSAVLTKLQVRDRTAAALVARDAGLG